MVDQPTAGKKTKGKSGGVVTLGLSLKRQHNVKREPTIRFIAATYEACSLSNWRGRVHWQAFAGKGKQNEKEDKEDANHVSPTAAPARYRAP